MRAPLVWRQEGRRDVLGVIDGQVWSWTDRSGSGNAIESVTVAQGQRIAERELLHAPYIGEPRAMLSLGGTTVGHWDGFAPVQAEGSALRVGPSTSPYSTYARAPGDTLLVADQHEVLRLSSALVPAWRTPMPAGAQPPELFPTDSTVGLVFQQYAPDAPTPRLTVHHRVRSLSLDGGQERFRIDFVDPLGAVHVRDDLIVFAQDADLVFFDARTQRELRRHARLGPPNIYPEVASDASHVVVALGGFVRSYSLAGEPLWQTRVPGVDSGAHLVLARAAAFVSTADGSVVALHMDTGALLWRIGTAIPHGALHPSDRGLIVEGAGSWAGIPLPVPPVALEQATLTGQVDLGDCGAAEVRVSDGERTVRVDARGRFRMRVRGAGFVGLRASRALEVSSEETLPACPGSAAVVQLTGQRRYTAQLRVCCAQ